MRIVIILIWAYNNHYVPHIYTELKMRSDYFQRVIFILLATIFMAASNSDILQTGLAPVPNLDNLQLNHSSKLSEKWAVSTNYRIFDSVGNVSTLEELITAIGNSDVTFLGEIHTDSVAHELEALLLKKSWDDRQSLSLEMFESDVQFVLDEYMKGLISEEHFLESARSWKNYESDYRELIEFSKERGMPVIAANAPRRYVNMVHRLGKGALLSLSEEGKQFLPPLPYPDASPEYENKFRAIMLAHQSMISRTSANQEANNPHEDEDLNQIESDIEEINSLHEETFERMLAAQNLWDSSMAWSIASHLKNNPNNRVIHVNGSFHTDFSLGIPEHLKNYLPHLDLLTVTIVPSLEYPNFQKSMKGLGDYIIITDGTLEPSH